MLAAKTVAQKNSLDQAHPTGAVVVCQQKIIGEGANGSVWHQQHGCERKRQNIPTGEGYDLCEGCHPKNHAEQKAIADALKKLEARVQLPEKTDLYLWGHWWCCQSCWERMIETGVERVYLLAEAEKIFKT